MNVIKKTNLSLAASRIHTIGAKNAKTDDALNTLLRYNSPSKKSNMIRTGRPFNSMMKTAIKTANKSPSPKRAGLS